MRAPDTVYWCNIKITNYIRNAEAKDPKVGKALERLLFPNRGFRRIPHGKEWYYDFKNREGLLKMMDWLDSETHGGMVTFPNVEDAREKLHVCLETA